MLNNSTLFMQGATIDNNVASEDGGGVFLANQSNFDLQAGVIRANQATNGGGIYADESSNVTGTNGFVTGNQATGDGGGIFSEQYEDELFITPDAYSNLMLSTNIVFDENSAQFASFGPANPEVIDAHIPSTLIGSVTDAPLLNNFDINYPVRNFATFTFFKRDELLYTDFDESLSLEGATFEMLRYENGTWTPIHTETSNEEGRVTFMPLRLQATYRLVEVTAPVGHQLPRGHWLIEIDEEGVSSITAEGEFVPAFRLHNEQYYLGNLTNFEIPVLGGLGVSETKLIASFIIMLSSLLALLVLRKRQKLANAIRK